MDQSLIGALFIVGVLLIFSAFLLFKAYKGIFRRQLSIRYKPFRVSDAESEAQPWKTRELTGWGAVVLGALYAVGGLGTLTLLLWMSYGLITS